MTGIEEAAAIAAIVAAAAGTAMTAVQSSNQAKYNAQVADNEATARQQEADYQTQQVKDRARRLLSTQRAQVGASGLDLEGSPLLVMEETAGQSELDALMIQHSATADEAKLRSQAAIDRMDSGNYLASGLVKSGAKLLSGGTSVYDNYYGSNVDPSPQLGGGKT